MGFDLGVSEVKKIRKKYSGKTPNPMNVISLASEVQENYIRGDSAVIGGITTLEGIQSTRTRRPLSASIDLIINRADISMLGEEYNSWRHGSAYFADVDGIEVGVLDINEFEPFEFPSSALENSYQMSFGEDELYVAEPESNIASKFNRTASDPENCKFSDYVDLNSHLHWYSQIGEVENLLDFTESCVDYNLLPVFRRLEKSGDNFNNEETALLKDVYDEAQLFLED